MRKRNRQRRQSGGGAEPVEILFGAQTTGGGGNWGGGTDRAMFRRLTLTSPNGNELTIKAVHLGIRIAGPGEFIKGLVYSDLGTAHPVGSRLGFSDAQSAGTLGYVRCPVTDIIIPSGTNVWAGGVWSFGASVAEFDSETVPVAPNTYMYNGSISYADPTDPAPGASSADYVNTLACFLECTYIPD